MTGLDWSTQEDKAKLLSLASPSSQDGQESHSCQSVIMAADVVYDHDAIASLVDTLAYIMEELGPKVRWTTSTRASCEGIQQKWVKAQERTLIPSC